MIRNVLLNYSLQLTGETFKGLGIPDYVNEQNKDGCDEYGRPVVEINEFN